MIYKKKIDGNVRSYYILGIRIVYVVNSEIYRYVYLLGFCIFRKFKLNSLCNKIEIQLCMLKSIAESFGNLTVILNESYNGLRGKIDESFNDLRSKIDENFNDLKVRVDNLNAVAKVHRETFSQYKDKYCGKDLVIVGTGPTLNQYIPINDAIHIGLNKAYKFKRVELDYIFIQDINGLLNDINYINNYNPDSCTKFYGIILKHGCSIPESHMQTSGAKRFYTGGRFTDFYPDISSSCLPDYGSVVFSALAFALYSNPRRIYLVGCDASDVGYFDNDQQALFSKHLEMHINGWNSFKKFKNNFYPETEVISINPVGLKGMFKDIYL